MATEAPNGESTVPAVAQAATAAPATDPAQRWETAFVYAFICKFTTLRKNIEGFETPMDLERALLTQGSDPVLIAIVAAFISNLRPATRDPAGRLEKNLMHIMEEYCNKENERSLWWNEERRRNINPLVGTHGYFSLTWDKKLEILRQLCEWQLTHCHRIKDMLDLAWGVKAAKHQKKIDKEANAPPPPDHPESKESLRLDPYGQDSTRKRYWALDDSPRIYMSGNPWKAICPFQSLSSTRDEFVGVLDDLKTRASQIAASEDGKPVKGRNKLEQMHLDLVNKLENDQLPKVDAELARAEKARKRFESKLLLAAQVVEPRTTRTRRQTQKPDYVYDYDEPNENDEEYADDGGPGSEDYEMDVEDEGGSYAGSSTGAGRRRSSRSTVLNSRKRVSEGSTGGRGGVDTYRGERRSTRLGNAPAIAFDDSEQALLPASKRARSSVSDAGSARAVSTSSIPAASTSTTTAAPITAVPPPNGKKKSRFWFYAIEGTPSAASTPPASTAALPNVTNGNGIGNGNGVKPHSTAPSVAPSETGASLIDGMEGVELTDHTAVNSTNGTATSANNETVDEAEGLMPPIRSKSVGSNMEMSDDGS